MPEIPYEKGAHYIFDRGYNDFGNLYTINRIGAFFVVSAKTNVRFKPETWNGGFRECCLRRNRLLHGFIKSSSKDCGKTLRKGICIGIRTVPQIHILTNNLTTSAETITELYRSLMERGTVLSNGSKQHLRIKKFTGHQRMQYAFKSFVL